MVSNPLSGSHLDRATALGLCVGLVLVVVSARHCKFDTSLAFKRSSRVDGCSP